jgi:hypothetical protein
MAPQVHENPRRDPRRVSGQSTPLQTHDLTVGLNTV